MTKSDVDGLEFLSPGLLVNLDEKSYIEYMKRQVKMKTLETRINNVEDKLDLILELLKGK